MPRTRRIVGLALALAPALAPIAPASVHGAESFYAVTKSNRLVSFNSDSPGAIRGAVRISGLVDQEEIAAIDVQPTSGRLYGVGTASRLYEIEPTIGLAQAVTRDRFDIFLRGADIGLDFNPVADELRLVTEQDQNLRIDPDSGQVADPDRDLAFAPGTAMPGADPAVGSLAYTNSVPGAITTQLFGLDTVRDAVVLQDPPNEGVLTPVGTLGIDAAAPSGFDVAGDGRAWAAFRPEAKPGVGLFAVDLVAGRAHRAARRNAIGTFAGRRRDPVRALAARGPEPDDRRAPRASVRPINDPSAAALLRRAPLRLSLTCDEACTAVVRLVLGGRALGRTRATVRGQAGTVRAGLRLSRRGRRILRRADGGRLGLRVVIRDAAGNVTLLPRRRPRAESSPRPAS